MTTRSSDYAGVQSNSQFLPYNWEDEDRFYTLHFALRDLFSSNVMPAVLPRLIKGACVVDIGCGNGPWITDMATQYSECEYVGVEPSVDMLPEAMPLPNVRFEVADIMDKLPFESNSVDVVHIRAQGLQFKKEEWVKALREVYRVLKPGGMVQLLELHNAVSLGNLDYDIATKLGPILEESGFQLAQLKKKKVHFASDGRLGETFVAVTLRTFQAAQDFLAPLMGLDIDDYRHRVEMVCAQCVKHNAHLTWYAYVGKKP
ncbi:S-adenosyl-L-methionine-dependent methyltransferase [Radiomyces spectabilis]|uniref:S-adenosyl-L-methionine-dependent methyltransferase n=1 Tax=Radiomyces spectabilis TaxID=64574 RepID=UPI00221E69DC|nr:S-adenosyl-L-methionine-dependent methyltransferase [Radiomyces spectabilis]KAI8391588.1 S-adenosyl-L-methionine-dependent methyltransferase [Radiomyces spectabilis]